MPGKRPEERRSKRQRERDRRERARRRRRAARRRRQAREKGRPPGAFAAFPIDVSESADEFVVEADLPGRRKQDVDVTVRGRRVTIAADPPDEARTGETGSDRADEYLHRGRRRQPRPAVRTVDLPDPVSEKRSRALFRDGVLEIRLPKADDGTRVEVS